MEKFQAYPLSPNNSGLLVIDDKASFPRFTSHDSGVSFTDTDTDSSISDELFDFDIDQPYCSTITNDVQMASTISDDDKKFFCENTVWAWHGEFARLIMAPAMMYDADYRLLLHDDKTSCHRAVNAQYSLMRLDNAKAQFRCHTCGHCWTSMRARCSFHVSEPYRGGIVLLKLYAQQCQYCYSIVSPLWYYDEICRVMKNLASTIFKQFFPDSYSSVHWDVTHNGIKPIKRSFQRRGNMNNKHNTYLCEACHLGLCY